VSGLVEPVLILKPPGIECWKEKDTVPTLMEYSPACQSKLSCLAGPRPAEQDERKGFFACLFSPQIANLLNSKGKYVFGPIGMKLVI
jgi:hypothetical protein